MQILKCKIMRQVVLVRCSPRGVGPDLAWVITRQGIRGKPGPVPGMTTIVRLRAVNARTCGFHVKESLILIRQRMSWFTWVWIQNNLAVTLLIREKDELDAEERLRSM